MYLYLSNPLTLGMYGCNVGAFFSHQGWVNTIWLIGQKTLTLAGFLANYPVTKVPTLAGRLAYVVTPCT